MNQGSAVREAIHIVKVYAPVFPIKEMFVHSDTIRLYLSTTMSTAISIAIGTIQCVESAKRAGDFYPTRESMFVDGIGTLISTFFGSILSMTGIVFINHSIQNKFMSLFSLHRSSSYEKNGCKTSLFNNPWS